MKLVLLGAPGSGKGTQAALLTQHFDLGYVSTGDVFRKAIEDQTELGKQAKRYLDDGLLVPDDIVLGMIEEVLDNLFQRKGFILDGFPRTIPQAEALEKILAKKNQPLTAVLNLEVPKELLIERLLSRKRADDTLETIEKRLQVFAIQTEPLINFYQSKSLLKTVQSVGSVEQVFSAIMSSLGLQSPLKSV